MNEIESMHYTLPCKNNKKSCHKRKNSNNSTQNQRKKNICEQKSAFCLLFTYNISLCILILGTFQATPEQQTLNINAIATFLYNSNKIAQSNRHLTTTQFCLQYPNQEWLLRYPKLGIHDSLLAM